MHDVRVFWIHLYENLIAILGCSDFFEKLDLIREQALFAIFCVSRPKFGYHDILGKHFCLNFVKP